MPPVIHFDRDFNARAACGATRDQSVFSVTSDPALVTCPACEPDDDQDPTGYDPRHNCGDRPCRHYELPGDA